MADTLQSYYNKVFDINGNMKVCGREACQNLIDYMSNRFGVIVGTSNGYITDKETIRKYVERRV